MVTEKMNKQKSSSKKQFHTWLEALMPSEKLGQANCMMGWKSGKLRLRRGDDVFDFKMSWGTEHKRYLCLLVFFRQHLISHQKLMLFENTSSKNSPSQAYFACNFPVSERIRLLSRSFPSKLSLLKQLPQSIGRHAWWQGPHKGTV